MKMVLRTFVVLLVLLLGLTTVGMAQDSSDVDQDLPPYIPSHPLDALTTEEVNLVSAVLIKSGDADDTTLFAAITLREPAKADVLQWKSGQSFQRRAFVIMRKDQKTLEAEVDIAAGKVISVRDAPGAQPMIMDREWIKARDAFMADPRLAAALAKRGLKAGVDIFCTPNSAGFFPGENGNDRRILKVPCFSSANKLHPALARPIEGLMGIVDSETGKVFDVIDNRQVEMPPAPAGYGESLPQSLMPMRPLDIVVPKGPNIRLSGNLVVDWLSWNFHVRADKRAGVIMSLVKFNDGTKLRDIAYQMNVSEMFVPYMDPDQTWSYRTFLDAGEFGLGYLLSSLQEGVDCPYGAFYTDLTFPNDIGGTFVRKNALCIFERPTGDPAWRHYSSGRKVVSGEPQYELVVRHVPTLGNYDYVVDYVFTPQGNVKLRVGATGFDAIKSVAAKDMDSPSAKEDTAYGSLIAPYTVAPFHDHYINFRLDLDADGISNSLVRDSFQPTAIDSPTRKSMWTLKTQRYAEEGPIVKDHAAVGGENWRVVNTQTKNALKQSPSLWLNAHHDAQSILDSSDPPQIRASFSAHSLWVTQHKQDELWASGLYPNLSPKDTGLPVYVSDSQNIIGQDLVMWYTMGFRHVTRPEDFPILPTFWHEMTIRPAFFFDRDPSMTFNSGRTELE